MFQNYIKSYPLVNYYITMERSTIFNGYISTISMVIFNSYVKLPEGSIKIKSKMLKASRSSLSDASAFIRSAGFSSSSCWPSSDRVVKAHVTGVQMFQNIQTETNISQHLSKFSEKLEKQTSRHEVTMGKKKTSIHQINRRWHSFKKRNGQLANVGRLAAALAVAAAETSISSRALSVQRIRCGICEESTASRLGAGSWSSMAAKSPARRLKSTVLGEAPGAAAPGPTKIGAEPIEARQLRSVGFSVAARDDSDLAALAALDLAFFPRPRPRPRPRAKASNCEANSCRAVFGGTAGGSAGFEDTGIRGGISGSVLGLSSSW